jgi:hypothetical protein
MSIFDDIAREANDPRHQDETLFAYLNRSNRVEADHVRQLVDSWLDHYPVEHRDPLVARFRSPIDDQHKSAFFELFLHELALVRGHKIVAIEPELAHTRKSPDFLFESSKGDRFYLEAVMATGRSTDDTAAQARLNQALTAIDKTPSPAHFLDLSVHGVPSAPVSISRMKRALQKWIAELPDDDTAKNVAPFVFNEHGARITIRACPRHKRDNANRAIGVRHFPLQQVMPHHDIHAALKKKASRYGVLDHPYIVAVNALGLYQREKNVIDALLGSPIMVIKKFADGSQSFNDERKRNGIWIDRNGARNRGLSAVLSTKQIDPWNFGSRRALLVRNPWAATELPAIALGTDELNPIDGAFHRIDGGNMASIFGLPEHWPEA